MPTENISKMKTLLKSLEKPVLIISTKVGRGMFYMGDALKESFDDQAGIHHRAIEEFLPRANVHEDVVRYKMISSHAPFLLNLVYRFPVIYYRKYLRERLLGRRLERLEETIQRFGIKTVVCVSHRAAFWVSNHKRLTRGRFELWDLLGEYGNNYGYKHLFWRQIDGFLSPIPARELRFRIPRRVRFEQVALPVRRAYLDLAGIDGDPNKVLLICGFWGQGPILKILKQLLRQTPSLHVLVVCGENAKAYEAVRAYARGRANISPFEVVESLVPLLRQCAGVITKPGISTLLEAHGANRQIFLLKGMPVAEDNNARYAISHFGAKWYDPEVFSKWLREIGRR